MCRFVIKEKTLLSVMLIVSLCYSKFKYYVYYDFAYVYAYCEVNCFHMK